MFVNIIYNCSHVDSLLQLSNDRNLWSFSTPEHKETKVKDSTSQFSWTWEIQNITSSVPGIQIIFFLISQNDSGSIIDSCNYFSGVFVIFSYCTGHAGEDLGGDSLRSLLSSTLFPLKNTTEKAGTQVFKFYILKSITSIILLNYDVWS